MQISYRCNMTQHATIKNGEHINTYLHYQYITGKGKYKNYKENNRKVIYTKSDNLPTWADNNPDIFWEKAEELRTREGSSYNKGRQPRGYREITVTLQMIFSLEENIECIDKLLEASEIKNKFAYTIAIHEEPARWDDELTNIHCHIMFDEREIEHDRIIETAEEYFKKHSIKKDGSITGGYKKNRFIRSKTYLNKIRKDWADIINKKLESKGIKERVSEKSLTEQAKELRKKGEIKKAKALERKPAPKMYGYSKNKKIQKAIKEKIQAIENGNTEKQNTKNMTKTEKMILLYAEDAVKRKKAKEILKE